MTANYNHNGINDDYNDNDVNDNHNYNDYNDNDDFIPLFEQKNVKHQFIDEQQ